MTATDRTERRVRPVHPLVTELHHRRIDRDWSQAELGRRSGVSHHAINRAEAGYNGYTLYTLEALAAAFDLEVCFRPKVVGRG